MENPYFPPLCRWLACWPLLCLLCALNVGCGTTQTRDATDQLLLSDAVDRGVSSLDFRPLSGQRVYLDTQYLPPVKNAGFVNSEYITSSIRQQVVASGCLLMDSKEEADIILEPRVGTLGADGHRVMYGIPGSNALSSASELLPSMPTLPVIPEIALARRESQEAAAKIAVFAYDRLTREPVWQSGIARSASTARDTWFFGVGPLRGGSIHDRSKLIGGEILLGSYDEDVAAAGASARPRVPYDQRTRFSHGWPVTPGGPPAPAPADPGAAPAPVDPAAPQGEERLAQEPGEAPPPVQR